MLAIITGLAVIAIIVYSQVTAGKDGKLPPASTLKGRRARIIGDVILAVLIVAAILYTSGGGILSPSNILSWLLATSVAAFFLIVRLRNHDE